MNGELWSEIEVENLRTMFTAEQYDYRTHRAQPKYTLEDLEDCFRRTENAIRLKASRLGLKRPELGGNYIDR